MSAVCLRRGRCGNLLDGCEAQRGRPRALRLTICEPWPLRCRLGLVGGETGSLTRLRHFSGSQTEGLCWSRRTWPPPAVTSATAQAPAAAPAQRGSAVLHLCQSMLCRTAHFASDSEARFGAEVASTPCKTRSHANVTARHAAAVCPLSDDQRLLCLAGHPCHGPPGHCRLPRRRPG